LSNGAFPKELAASPSRLAAARGRHLVQNDQINFQVPTLIRRRHDAGYGHRKSRQT